MPSSKDNSVFEKLRRAYEEDRGTNLTAQEVNRLMSSIEVFEFVMEQADAEE